MNEKQDWKLGHTSSTHKLWIWSTVVVVFTHLCWTYWTVGRTDLANQGFCTRSSVLKFAVHTNVVGRLSSNVGHAPAEYWCLLVSVECTVSAHRTESDNILKTDVIRVQTIFGGQELWKIARFWSVVTPYLIFKKFLPPTNRVRPIRGHSITITKHENGRPIGTVVDGTILT